MPFRRRRPLLRGAAVGAAGYAIGKHAQQGQDEAAYDDSYDDQGEPAAEAPGGLTDAAIEQLQKLGKLKDDGILTQAEFDEQKRHLLGGDAA